MVGDLYAKAYIDIRVHIRKRVYGKGRNGRR